MTIYERGAEAGGLATCASRRVTQITTCTARYVKISDKERATDSATTACFGCSEWVLS